MMKLGMHPRQILWIAFGAVGVAAAAVGVVLATREGPPDPDRQYSRGGEVRRLSGDHLKLDDGRVVEFAAIRLLYGHEPYADKARDVLNRWIDDEGVRLMFDELREDRDGRLLAYVYANETFINERLVRDGLAFVKLRQGNRQHADVLLAAQTEARREERGLWQFIELTSQGQYVADPVSATFHRANCEKVGGNDHPLESLTGTAAAIDAGYAPCGKCRPLESSGK